MILLCFRVYLEKNHLLIRERARTTASARARARVRSSGLQFDRALQPRAFLIPLPVRSGYCARCLPSGQPHARASGASIRNGLRASRIFEHWFGLRHDCVDHIDHEALLGVSAECVQIG